MRGQFRRQIPKINRAFYRIIFPNKDKDEFCIGNDSTLADDFSCIYKGLLLRSSLTNVSIWERKWSTEVGFENVVLDWKKIWTSVHNKISCYNVHSSIWEMIHRNYICGYSLRQMNFANGRCKLCNQQEEQRIHIFMKCAIIDKIYLYFTNMLLLLENSPLTEVEKAFGIYDKINNNVSLRNYITYTIRHIVYRNRNLNLNEGQNAEIILIKKVKMFLKKDLNNKFNLRKAQNKLDLFKSMYLINNTLGNLQNGELIFSF
jgi:hypothetical protein